MKKRVRWSAVGALLFISRAGFGAGFSISGATVTLANSAQLTTVADITINSGQLAVNRSSVTLGGNWTNSKATSFLARTSTVTFTATASRTITSRGAPFNIAAFTGVAGYWTLLDSMTVSTMTIGALATVDINSFNLGVASFTNSGNFTLQGTEQVNRAPLNVLGSTVTYDGTSTGLFLSSWTYAGVYINGPAGTFTTTGGSTTINGDLTINAGTLAFSRVVTSSITMVGGDVTINSGGTLDMGTSASPIAGSSATLVLAYGATDGQYGLLLNDGGNFFVNGAPKIPYAIATSSAGAGSLNVPVPAAGAIGWSVGDVITIGATELSATDQTEQRTITGLSAGSPTAVSWAGGLSNNHFSSSTSTLVISNLSRNVLVRSSSTAVGGGGHASSFTTLSTAANGFVLVEGEFAYLGGGGRINLGTTGSTAIRAFISSCTIRQGAEIDPIGMINSTFTWSNFYSSLNGGMLLDTNSKNNVFSYNNSFSNQGGSGIELYQAGSGNQILYNYSYSNNFGFGIYAWSNTTGGDVIQGNRVFANPYSTTGGALTIASGNEIVTGNIIYNNNNLGISCVSANNLTITSNTISTNLTGITPGIKLSGCSNSLISGNTLTNNGWGIALDNSSNFNTVSFNQVSGSDINFYIGLSISNISFGNRYFGAVNTSEGDGMYYDGGANQNTFIADQSYGNAQYGLELNTNTGNVCAGCFLGYNGGTASASALGEIRIAVSPANLILRNSVVNFTSGIDTGSINQAGDYILSYNQDFATGTVKVYGDYTVSGTTFTLGFSTPTYLSAATTPKLMIGAGHSISSVVTFDGITLSEIITATALDSGHWQITGSSSGVINASFVCAQGSPSCSFTSSKVNFTLTTGNPTFAGDTVDFAVLSSGKDAGIRKKLSFGPVASGLNNGRSKMSIASGAGFYAEGQSAVANPTLIDWINAGSTYYSFVDSGAFTVQYASFTRMDENGIWLNGSGPFSINHSTFDYVGNRAGVGAGTLLSLNAVIQSTITLLDVTYGNNGGANPKHNYTLSGAVTGLSWSNALYSGGLAGVPFEQNDPAGHIIWAPTGCSTFTSVATGNWSNPAVWDSAIVPAACNAVVIASPTVVSADVLPLVSTLTINTGGTFDLNAFKLTVSSFTNKGSFILNGTQVVTSSPTNVLGSTVTLDNAGGVVLVLSSWTYRNLIVNGSGGTIFSLTASPLAVNETLSVLGGTFTTTTNNYNLNVGGDMIIGGGTVTLNASQMTVGGDWSMTSGYFNANSSTVTFTSSATLTGSTSFYNLTEATAGAMLTLPANSTQTVKGILTLTGIAGNPVYLRSSIGGTYAYLAALRGQSVNFVDVQDNNASGGIMLSALSGTLSHTVNWSSPCSPRSSNGTGGGNWSTAASWSPPFVPTSCNVIDVVAGDTITVVGNVQAGSTTVEGVLTFDRTANSTFTLVGGAFSVNSGGVLDMGKAGTPFTASRAALILAYGDSSSLYGLTINAGGSLFVYGASKTSYSTYAGGAAAIGPGTPSIAVADATGWAAGDLITVDAEAVTISAGGIAGNTITAYTPSLSQVHYSTMPIRVANLSRSVVIRSSGTDPTANTAYVDCHATGSNCTVNDGEFAYLGKSNCVTAECGFGLNGDDISVSSSSFRYGYDGISAFASGLSLTGNAVFGNTSYGVYVTHPSNTLAGNMSYGNTGTNFNIQGTNNILSSNMSFFSQASAYTLGNNNYLIGNSGYLSQGTGDGCALGSNDVLVGNNFYANGGRGIALFGPGPSGNVLAGNNSFANGDYGVGMTGGGNNNNTFIGTSLWSNQDRGIYSNGANGNKNNVFADGHIGYSSMSVASPDTTSEIEFDNTAHTLTLKNTEVNSSPGIAYTTLQVANAWLLSYNQDNGSGPDTGTVRVAGDFSVSGSTFSVDYSTMVYLSTATVPILIMGSGHSAQVKYPNDANAMSQMVTLTYNGSDWNVDGSVSGSMGHIAAGSDQNIPTSGPVQCVVNITQGGAPQSGDLLAFGLIAASGDAGQQKKILFEPNATGLNHGRSKITVASNAGFKVLGDPATTTPSLMSWDSLNGNSTYYTFVDSGAFTISYASITYTDPLGVQFWNSSKVTMATSTFDQGSLTQDTPTGAYFTGTALVTATTFYGLTFLNTPNNSASAFFNVNATGVWTQTWTMQLYFGPWSGAAHTTGASSAKVVWGSLPRLRTWTGNTSTDWSNAGNWDSGVPVATQDSALIPSSAVRMPTLTAAVSISSLTITAGSSMTLAGFNLTLSSFTNAGNFLLNGIEVVSRVPTNVIGSSVSYIGASGAQIVLSTWTYRNLVVNGGSAITFNAKGGLVVNENLSVLSGILNTNTNFFISVASDVYLTNAAGTLTLNASSVTVAGDWVNSAGTFNTNTSTVVFTSAGTKTIQTAGDPFNNIQFNGVGGSWVLQDSMTVISTVTISNGILNTSVANCPGGTSCNMSVGGSWYGTPGGFTVNTSTVVFTGAKPLKIFTAQSPFYNLQLSGTAASTWVLQDSMTVVSTVTLTAGAFDPSAANCGSSCGLSVGGSWFGNGGTFIPRTSTVTLTGAVPGLSIRSSGKTNFTKLILGGSGGYWTLIDSMTVPTATITSGATLDVNGFALNTSSLTNQGNFELQGFEGVLSAPLNVAGSSVTYDATSGTRVIYSTWTYRNLVVNGGTTTGFNPKGVLVINENFSVLSGTVNTTSTNYGLNVAQDVNLTGANATLTMNASSMTVGGDWINSSANFDANTSTIVFSGAAAQTIDNAGRNFWVLLDSNTSGGGVTFASSFTANTIRINSALNSPTTMYFNAGSTFTVTRFSANGTAANKAVWMRSTQANQLWTLNNTSTNSVSYVDVQDSDARMGQTIIATVGSLNSGNNFNWNFGPPGAPSAVQVYLSSITVTYGANSNADGYEVDAAMASNFSGVVFTTSTDNASLLTLAVSSASNLAPNTTYFLRAGALYNGTTAYNTLVQPSTSTLAEFLDNVLIYQIGATNIVVNWTPFAAGSGPNTSEGYALNASSTNFNGTGVVYMSSNTTPVTSTLTVSGLTAGVLYQLRVGAYNHNRLPNFMSAGSATTLLGPAAVTDLASVPQSNGDVLLTWSAPLDPAYNPLSVGSQYAIEWATYTVVWSTSSTGDTTSTNTWHVYIATSGVTPGAAQQYVASGLAGNIDYNFRLWTMDPGSFWSPISNSTDTFVNPVLAITLPSHAYNFGPVNVGISSQSTTSLMISNNGNIPETYSLSVTTTGPKSVWQVGIVLPTSYDTFVMFGAFHPVQPLKSAFAVGDILTSTPTVSSGTQFSIDGSQTGLSVPMTGDRLLWLRLDMPLTVSTTDQEQMNVTVTANTP